MEPTPTPPLPVRELPAAPPRPPRSLTTADRHAIFVEPRVRRWWIMAVVVTLMFTAFCGDRLWNRHVESDLIRNGVVRSAKVDSAENKQRGMPYSTSDKVGLLVIFPTGPQEYHGDIYLTKSGIVGNAITLHMDPNDPTRWTDRSEPTPLLDSLFVGLIALPIVPLLIVLGVMQRNNLRKLWQSGSAALAVVHDRKTSPLAPTSYALRVSLQESQNRDVFTVYVPRIGMGLEKGDLIWVVTGKRNEQPLAALWMPSQTPGNQSGIA